MRLSLLPNLRQLWRDARTVQLGTDPARAVVLEFSDPIATRVLDLLDGSRTEEQVLMDASANLAVDMADTITVLNALWAAGLLIDAHTLLPSGLPEPARLRLLPEAAALALRAAGDQGRQIIHPSAWHRPEPTVTPADALRRRSAAKVLVTGPEILVAPVAVALASAGVGHVDPVVDGRGRPGHVLATIARTAPDARLTPIRTGSANVIVRIGPRPSRATGGRWRLASVLSVCVRDGIVLVGPFVVPGASPCARCLDLHRTDRDPAWPVLAAQLATMPAVTETCALTTTIAASAYIAEEVLSHLDGRPIRTSGAAVEIDRPGEERRRSWNAHPRCECVRRHRPGPQSSEPAQRIPVPSPGRNDP